MTTSIYSFTDVGICINKYYIDSKFNNFNSVYISLDFSIFKTPDNIFQKAEYADVIIFSV